MIEFYELQIDDDMVTIDLQECRRCGEEFYPVDNDESLCEDCRENDETLAKQDFVYRKWKQNKEDRE